MTESSPSGGSEPGDTLGEVLLALGGRLTRLQTEILAALPQPLTIRQYRILARVDGGNTSLTALSKLARRNLSTMSESVDKMVTQGLLTRSPSERSRRTMRLALTPAGAVALDAANRALTKFTSAFTTTMPQELHDQVLSVLQQLYFDIQRNLDDE
jgi:DNA-binding MarR family transcriptional regulator